MKKAAHPQTTITVSARDLPLCCPPKEQSLWSSHPRVYFHFSDTKEVRCPYCGNHFRLDGPQPKKH